MTPASHQPVKLFDLGSVVQGGSLADRHLLAQQLAGDVLKRGGRWCALGGGHDYAYADGAAFLSTFKDNPLVLNFDAHLDVRQPNGSNHSGTPFFRLLTQHEDFDFGEIGIQPQCASPHHIDWLEKRGGRMLGWNEICAHKDGLLSAVKTFLEPWLGSKRPLFLSIDIDGFSSAFAMGCSQSFATGFEPNGFLPLLSFLADAFDVRAVGIYEVSPPLDLDTRTARLAAQLMHHIMWSVK